MKTTFTLNNGKKIPALGLGTWKAEPGVVGEAVRAAIVDSGYRHIDCAAIYGNEKEVGKGLDAAFKSGVNREDVFVTSKLWNTEHHPDNVEKACQKTLDDLGLEYLDLYLVHWGIAFEPSDGDPEPIRDGQVVTQGVSTRETWEAMEKLVEKGFVRSIGVSNFTVTMLVDLLTYAKIKPVVNQVELHPYLSQTALVDFCKQRGILPVAYSPLVHGGLEDFKHGVIGTLADKYRKTPAQIMLNWAISRGTCAIPKSSNPKRIAENADIFDFELTKSELGAVSTLNKNYRTCDPIEWWGVPYFA